MTLAKRRRESLRGCESAVEQSESHLEREKNKKTNVKRKNILKETEREPTSSRPIFDADLSRKLLQLQGRNPLCFFPVRTGRNTFDLQTENLSWQPSSRRVVMLPKYVATSTTCDSTITTSASGE